MIYNNHIKQEVYMVIDGIEYKKFEDIENEFGMKTGSIQRLCKKYSVSYKVLGNVKLISETELSNLLEKNSKDKEEQRKKRSRQMKGKKISKKPTTNK